MANFLSHPVTNGFISASALLIAASQLKHLFGVESSGHDLVTVLTSLGSSIAGSNPWTCIIGVSTLLFLVGLRRSLGPTLQRVGVQAGIISVATRVGPALAVVTAATATWLFDLSARGVAIVGTVPQGLPPLSLPPLDLELWQSLFVSAALISVVGFVESVSVAQTLAAKRRQRIEPDQELIGLGAANLGAAFTGGYPVTGGFARSVVNFDAGARTPAAGIFTAMTIALATLTLTPALYYLPNAVLAATIIVAVLGLIDMGSLTSTWRYSKADFSAQLSTIVLTLGVGIEAGIMVGVGVSIALYLYRTSRPHYAAVGQVPGTEHFRNIERHDVVTDPQVLNLRVDESLYFPNARFLEDAVVESVSQAPKVRHVVLMCSAVNDIDASALESIETINARLSDAGIGLHLSEVKGPVMDRLQRSHLLEHLNGHVYLTQFDAFAALAPVAAQRAMNAVRVTS